MSSFSSFLQQSALAAACLAVGLAAAARPAPPAAPPPAAHADTETSTNVPFAAPPGVPGRISFALSCRATPSNNAEGALNGHLGLCAANVSVLSGEIVSNGFTSTLQARIAALVKDEVDGEDRVALQTNIWRIVFDRQVSILSSNYVDQVRNLSETAAFLTSFRACTQNDACLELLSMHLGGMTELSTKEHDRLCRAAYDRDLALQGAPCTRLAGSHGRMGPNMKAWRAKRARFQTWNRLVGEYRRDILSLMAANMRAFVAGLDDSRRAQFKRMFISRAKLTEEETDVLFGKDDQ